MYKECITCHKLGTECDGANLIALPSKDLIEWCKLRKAHLKMSNAKIAELANVPKGTVDRIFAADGEVDFRYESIRPLVQALLGGAFDGNPCPDPDLNEQAAETIKRLEEDNQRLRKLYYKTLDDHRDDIDAERAAEDFLMKQIKQKDRKILVLTILLAILLSAIIIALIVDVLNPDVGFFWLKELFSGTGNGFHVKYFV